MTADSSVTFFTGRAMAVRIGEMKIYRRRFRMASDLEHGERVVLH